MNNDAYCAGGCWPGIAMDQACSIKVSICCPLQDHVCCIMFMITNLSAAGPIDSYSELVANIAALFVREM